MEGLNTSEQPAMSENVLLTATFDQLVQEIPQDENYQLDHGSRGSIAWWLDNLSQTKPANWHSEVEGMISSWKTKNLPPAEVDFQIATKVYEAIVPVLKKEIDGLPEGREKELKGKALSQLTRQRDNWVQMKENGDRIPVNIVPPDRWPDWFKQMA